ncbi:hypothetical protein KIN20_011284 [Parelaphostrongylus tenuis]|uniref:Uncharacterized protein n=1 Tax=Parelaphostrongylus tenuis TaxID=148309 RepID=A0AAD5MCL8_PARTN|nr:hypothetical protein KIN20_011284 [Parelaphostrongylus tenuis]
MATTTISHAVRMGRISPGLKRKKKKAWKRLPIKVPLKLRDGSLIQQSDATVHRCYILELESSAYHCRDCIL